MGSTLYQTLCIDLPTKDLTVTEKRKLIKDIDRLSDDAHGVLYELIKEYNSHTTPTASDDLIPYNGKVVKEKPTDVSFDMKNVPIQLRHMIQRFITQQLNSSNS